MDHSVPEPPPEKLGGGSRIQEGERGLEPQALPGGTDADIAVPEAIPVADVEAVPVEVPDTRDDTGVGRRRLDRALLARRPAIRVRPLTGLAEDEDVLCDLGDGGRHFVLGREHGLLLFRRLVSRTRNDLPEHDVESWLEHHHVSVWLTNVPRVLAEVELRLAGRRVNLEPPRHRE